MMVLGVNYRKRLKYLLGCVWGGVGVWVGGCVYTHIHTYITEAMFSILVPSGKYLMLGKKNL